MPSKGVSARHSIKTNINMECTSRLCSILLFYVEQFLTSSVDIDAEYNLIKFPYCNPISVKQATAWPYMGISEKCWHGAATDNQATGVIEGVYTDITFHT